MVFTGLTITFVKEFCFGLWLTLPLWAGLAVVIAVLGQMVGRVEGWTRFDSLYWSFITATTVGYGDFRPRGRKAKVASIALAFAGLTMSGIVIAVAVQAATLALGSHR
jgi:voltage-gated potassium channel